MHTMEGILAKIIKPIQDHAKNIVFVLKKCNFGYIKSL